MKIENLTKEQRLDLEILIRVVEISDFLSSGEAELKINPLDSDELIGSIIKRALSLADGAVINIVDCPVHRELSNLSKSIKGLKPLPSIEQPTPNEVQEEDIEKTILKKIISSLEMDSAIYIGGERGERLNGWQELCCLFNHEDYCHAEDFLFQLTIQLMNSCEVQIGSSYGLVDLSEEERELAEQIFSNIEMHVNALDSQKKTILWAANDDEEGHYWLEENGYTAFDTQSFSGLTIDKDKITYDKDFIINFFYGLLLEEAQCRPCSYNIVGMTDW